MKSDPKWWPAAGARLLRTQIWRFMFRRSDILWALQDIITQSKLTALILDRKQTESPLRVLSNHSDCCCLVLARRQVNRELRWWTVSIAD